MDRDDLAALFAPVLAVSIKRMFGGYGIYGPEGIFAIAVEGSLFFKVDDASRAEWIAAGATPFRYEKKSGQQTVMSYFSLPEAAYDDPDLLRHWVKRAREAAWRAGADTEAKPRRKAARE